MHVASVFSKWFQVFHTFVASVSFDVCNGFQVFLGVFASVSDACFKCFICLLCMLQLLHPDVSKVDRGMHMGCAWEAAGSAGDVRGGARTSKSGMSLLPANPTRWGARSLTERVSSDASAPHRTSEH
jgi:hypothetical protein